MIVRVFYNQKAFSDILYVILHDREVESWETKDNITKLLDKDNDIIGYNINIHNFKSERDGYQPMSHELLKLINGELNRVFQEELIHDFNSYIVVGFVSNCEPHPDSDHLHVCQVDIGKEILQIVCGASNVMAGQKVVVCLENAVLSNGKLIKKGKLRNVTSNGMLASAHELGLIDEKKKGILVLDDTYTIGEPFLKG